MRGLITIMARKRRLSWMTILLGLLYGLILINIAIQLVKQNASVNLAIDKSLASLGTSTTAQQLVTRLKKDVKLQRMVKVARMRGGTSQVARVELEVSRMLQKSLRADLRLDIVHIHSRPIEENITDSISQKLQSVFLEQTTVSYLVYRSSELKYFDLLQYDLGLTLASMMGELNIKVYDPETQSVPEDLIRVSLNFHYVQRKLDFYHNILTGLILKHRPEEKPFALHELGIPLLAEYSCIVLEPPLSRRALLRDHLHPRTAKYVGLQASHANLVRDIKRLPDPPRELFNGDGIVVGAYGGLSLGSALVAIAQIREMGSRLPIEVVIATENDFSAQICNVLMPTHFDAKCIVIEREIGGATLDYMKISQEQLKVFGLLFTSFDNTIYIDESTLVLKNIDSLIYSEPYLLTKFVLWPDVWHRTTSPFFYDIAGIELGWPLRRGGAYNAQNWSDYAVQSHMVDVALHDLEGAMPDVTIDSGQMVFSKREHFRSLLLATYYTIFGPDFYWPLLYQNVDGPTSRDPFLPALTVMNEQYHVVGRELWYAGYTSGEPARFHATSIVQHDPTQSAQFDEQWAEWLSDVKGLDPRLSPYQCNRFTQDLRLEFVREQQRLLQQTLDSDVNETAPTYLLPDAMFIRGMTFAINPAKASEEEGEATVFRRYLGKLNTFPELGNVDWELKFHTISKWLACQCITNNTFWEKFSKIGRQESCKVSKDFVLYLMRDTTDIGSQYLPSVE